mmetsp:Transcript_38122/g.83035  ORF Transcript_38122/g.83035 Transcript_38122/m.83035 type:complete len:296 (+) Transcript_38122:1986-2873(+)
MELPAVPSAATRYVAGTSMFSSSVPKARSWRPWRATQRCTSLRAFRCGRGMVLSMRFLNCVTCRSASSRSRMRRSRLCIRSLRFSAHCSSCSFTFPRAGASVLAISPSSFLASACLAAMTWVASVPNFSARPSSASHCFSCLALCSRRALRAAISSPRALFRCCTEVYCCFRPCCASSWSRCASQTCFFCSSLCLSACSASRVGCSERSSALAVAISPCSRLISACASERDFCPSSTRFRSSSSSSLARVSSSRRATRMRSWSSLSTVSMCFRLVSCCTSASMLPMSVRSSAASR